MKPEEIQDSLPLWSGNDIIKERCKSIWKGGNTLDENKKEIVYTGEAEVAHNEVLRCEQALKEAKTNLKNALAKQRSDARKAAAQKRADAKNAMNKALTDGTVSAEALMEFLNQKSSVNTKPDEA